MATIAPPSGGVVEAMEGMVDRVIAGVVVGGVEVGKVMEGVEVAERLLFIHNLLTSHQSFNFCCSKPPDAFYKHVVCHMICNIVRCIFKFFFLILMLPPETRLEINYIHLKMRANSSFTSGDTRNLSYGFS